MKKMKIYLAGPLSKWRDKVISELREIYEFYNPLIDSRQKCQAEYTPDDLEAVKNCDMIIAYQPKDRTPCLAMAVEATLGFCNGAIVIYVDERGSPDPIMIGISKRPFYNLEEAIEFLKEFAKNPESQGISKNLL